MNWRNGNFRPFRSVFIWFLPGSMPLSGVKTPHNRWISSNDWSSNGYKLADY